MELWSKSVAENKTGLKIDDGVLVKCKIKDGVVTIPDNVKAVVSDAFDGCEYIRINRSPGFIRKKLEEGLIMAMEDLKDENENPDDSGTRYYPIYRVFGVEDKEVGSVLQTIIADVKVKGFREYIAVDADELNEYRLEVITAKIRNTISKEGYKILFLENLTPETADALPRNFINNLVKSQSFNHLDLGIKCLVVLGIGNGTRLDEPGDVGSHFLIDYYKNLTPKAFMREMRLEGKVIEAVAETEKGSAQQEAKTLTSEPEKYGGKEID